MCLLIFTPKSKPKNVFLFDLYIKTAVKLKFRPFKSFQYFPNQLFIFRNWWCNLLYATVITG